MVLLRPTLKILRDRVCVWSARMCVWFPVCVMDQMAFAAKDS